MQDPSHENIERIHKWLTEIIGWIYQAAGIQFSENRTSVELYKNLKGESSIQAKLIFNGPLQRKTNFSSVKLDLTSREKIVLPGEVRQIYHPYSDHSQYCQILSYPFEEIFAEKLRALLERARPRDLYDVVHLYHHREQVGSKQRLLSVLQEKCEFKKISMPSFTAIENHPQRFILSSEWKNMLAHQLPVLDPFEKFWNQLPTVFEWLHREQD